MHLYSLKRGLPLMGRPLSVSKSLAEFAARRRQRSPIIFSCDLCVRENTAQAASVEFRRFAPKLCAQQTWGPLSEKPGGFFDSFKRASHQGAPSQRIKKPRRVCRPQAAKKSNYFLSRHVRERKYRSGCQCGILPRRGKIMRAADCDPFVGKTKVFSDSFKRAPPNGTPSQRGTGMYLNLPRSGLHRSSRRTNSWCTGRPPPRRSRWHG